MRKILITGQDSYIGTSVEKWLAQFPDKYQVDTVNMLDASWRQKDFSKYSVVFHVAGIAHVDVGSISEEQKQMYFKINRDLTVETARKSKGDGVKQFIYMSSIIIYGSNVSLRKRKVISKQTEPKPDSCYGESKLQAEMAIRELEDVNFQVTILRPPMIYGKGGKGNYPKLSKIACILKFFPDFQNQRSMLYIDNLCEFIRLVIEKELTGVLYPQNGQYVKTADMVQQIASVHGKKIILVSLFNWLIYVISFMPGKSGALINKAFGSLIYDKDLSELGGLPIQSYQVKDFSESIKETEL